MDTTALVENRIDEGKRLVETLVSSRFPVDAAFWLYFPEAAEWRLVVATPLYDTKGPRATYARIDTVLSSATSPAPMALTDITVRSPSDELIEALRSANRIGTGVVGRRLRGVALDGVFIEDAYIYLIADQAYLPIELPRRAVPVSEVGSTDDKCWNNCLLAGLLGLPIQHLQGIGVPDQITKKSLEGWLVHAQSLGFIKRWKRDPTPVRRPGAMGYVESSSTWARRITRWLHKGYYPVVTLQDGRLVMLCGVREDRQEHHSPHEQVLVSSPATVEEWLRCSDFFRQYKLLPSGEIFVKPAAQVQGAV